MRYIHTICVGIVLLLLVQCIVHPVAAEKTIVLDFFYSGGCLPCEKKFSIIQGFEHNETYNNTVIFHWRDYAKDSGDEIAIQEYDTIYYPIFRENISFPLSFVVIKNETNRTIITNITNESIAMVLDTYISGVKPTEQSNGTPGFELIPVVIAISLVILWKRKRELFG